MYEWDDCWGWEIKNKVEKFTILYTFTLEKARRAEVHNLLRTIIYMTYVSSKTSVLKL